MRQLELEAAIGGAIRAAVCAETIVSAAIDDLRHTDRLAIHARHYRASLTAVLAAAFPAVRRLTGEGFFAYAAAQFIAAEPPRDPVLDHYGAAFPAFLGDFPPSLRLPWLGHLARFEWVVHAVSLACPAGATAVPPADAANARARWSAASAIFAAPFAVDAISAPGADEAAFAARDTHLLLVASDDAVAVHVLSAAAFVCLGALNGGTTLADAIAAGLAIEPSFDPAPSLRAACSSGAIRFFI